MNTCADIVLIRSAVYETNDIGELQDFNVLALCPCNFFIYVHAILGPCFHEKKNTSMKKTSTKKMLVRRGPLAWLPPPKRRVHQPPRDLFTFTQCTLCGALRDDSERSLCCMHGACLFLSDAFPDHGEAFKELCVSTQDLSDISRALNNRLAFASIGSDYDRDRVRFPWEYRQATAKPFPGPMYRGPG